MIAGPIVFECVAANGDITFTGAAASFTSDAFADVRTLIALVTDPKGCAARLQSLQERQAAAIAAEAKLAAERADFAAEMDKQRAEIEARDKESYARRAKLMADEAVFKETQERVAEQERSLTARSGRFEQFGNGMVRDWGDRRYRDDERMPDAEEHPSEPPLPVEGFGHAHTLTREPESSARRGRKSMRRRR